MAGTVRRRGFDRARAAAGAPRGKDVAGARVDVEDDALVLVARGVVEAVGAVATVVTEACVAAPVADRDRALAPVVAEAGVARPVAVRALDVLIGPSGASPSRLSGRGACGPVWNAVTRSTAATQVRTRHAVAHGR